MVSVGTLLRADAFLQAPFLMINKPNMKPPWVALIPVFKVTQKKYSLLVCKIKRFQNKQFLNAKLS